MTREEAARHFAELVEQLVLASIDARLDPLRSQALASGPGAFEEQFMERYQSHESLEQGTFRLFLRWLSTWSQPAPIEDIEALIARHNESEESHANIRQYLEWE